MSSVLGYFSFEKLGFLWLMMYVSVGVYFVEQLVAEAAAGLVRIVEMVGLI